MDKYQKIRVLGKGSFGSAILIKRICDETLFVVKEVSFAKMSPREREEARHECTVLQQIKHPNIVRYIEHFENHNSLYIVMEYCDGGDLGGKIKHNRGPLKESTIMYYFSQICLAMEYLHSRHILHRDIKTMNIFLMKNGAVKLGDFGIATVLRNTMGVANTVCGTPYYFSPELCKNRPYNNKSDIWAMGILLYECATCGRHPFDGANMNQLMTRIVRGNYAPLSMSYSPEFRRLVEWCLQKTPARRPNIRQTLSLPIVRRSLEMLEQNLMLATQCRIRLKDIMDFDAALDVQGQNVDDPNKTEDFSDPSTAEPLSQGLTPGQAAAMAMARQLLPHPKPNPVAVMRLKPPGMKPKLAMPLPYSPYQQHIMLHAHHPNHRSPGKIQTPKLMVKSSPTSAVQESVDAAPSTTSGSSPASCGPSTIPSEDPVDATNESVEMKRINAIIERYGNQDPRAKETIHAYMRRKQEEYQLRRKADMERRERRVAQRQSELKRVLERQRQAFQRNVDVISKPRKLGGQQQPGHPVVVARADPFRGLAPYMKVKEKPRRSAVNVKDVGKLAPPRRVAVAANSPRTLMDQSLDLMPALEPLAELQSASEMHASPLRPSGNPRAPPVVSTSTSGEQSMSRDERDLRRRMEKEREAAVHERMRADQRERVSHARELHGISARGRAPPTKTSPAPKSASAARRSPLTSPTAAARRPMSSDAPPTDGHRLNHKSHSLPDCLPLALNGAAPRRTSAIPPAALNAQDLSSGSPTDVVFDGVSPRHHHLEPLSPVKLSPAMRLRSGDSSSTPSPSYPIGKTFERKSHTHVTGDPERGSNDSIEAELIDVPYGIGRPQEQRPKKASLSPVRSGSRKTDVYARHIHRTNDEWVGVKRHPRSAEGAIYAGMARGPTVEDDSHLQLLHSMNLAMPSTLDAMDPARVSGEVSPSIPSSPHTASLHPLSITAISLGNMEDLRAAHHRASVAVSPRVERQSSTTEYDEMLQHLKDLLQKRGNHRAHPTSAGSSSKRRHAPPSPDADETDEDEEDRDGEEDGSESEGSFEELASGSSSTGAEDEDEDEDFADELPLSSPRYVVCEDSPQQHRHARVPSGDVEVSDRLHPLECHTPRELQPIKRPSATRT